jgi:hypothetical protein
LGSIEKKSLKFAGSPDRKLYRISDLKNRKLENPAWLLARHQDPGSRHPGTFRPKKYRYIGSHSVHTLQVQFYEDFQMKI